MKAAAHKTATRLTARDLINMESESNGYGLLGHEIRRPAAWMQEEDPYAAVRRFDEVVAHVANLLGWTYAQLFEFADSRYARHACDGMYGHSIDEVDASLARAMASFTKMEK